MKIKSTLFFILVFVSFCSFGQDEDIQPYIKAWKKSGKDQSYASQVFFDSLRINKDDVLKKNRYWSDIRKLHRYLRKHPDRRLEVRLLMFEIMAAREHSKTNQYYKTIDEAIKKAHPLQDPQLTAELYSIRADIPPSAETHLLYNLKTLEIQRKIGFKYFPYVPNRFFGVSSSLYGQENYKQSISYGREFFDVWHLDSVHRDPRVYIFQCDFLGAAYLKLRNYDSSRWYYSKIIEALKKEKDPRVTTLWSGIAIGNIGKTYINEGNFSKAQPLLSQYLQQSISVGDSLNIAMSQNAFASFYIQQNEYELAYAAAKYALSIAKRQNIYAEIIQATNILAQYHQKYNHADSAVHYYKLSNGYQNLLKDSAKKSELSVIKAQIAFDNLEYSFNQALATAQREKNLRNAILIGIILITIIVLLLYNRKRVKDKSKLQDIQLKQAVAEQKVIDAREKIILFTNNLIEQNNLIKTLQEELEKMQSTSSETTEQLLTKPLLTEDGWETFRVDFSKAYPSFFHQLRQQSDNLTPAMERLAALIFLQLNNYQIANSLGISKESVSRSKRRLRSVLSLNAEISLEDHITSLGNTDKKPE